MDLVNKEKERLKALYRYRVLDSPPEPSFDRLTQFAALVCQTPISLISLLDDERQWFKSSVGITLCETSRELAFCQYTIQGTTILEVPDTTRDERFRTHPAVVNDPHIRFYAGCPLMDPDGYALGTLCVLDYSPRKLNPDQLQALTWLSEMAVELIVQHRQKQELAYLDNLFSTSNDLICVANTDGYFQKVNPSFQQVLGWDNAYLLRTSVLDLIHPDDVASTQAEISKLAAGIPTINFEHRFRCQDGRYRHIQWVATPEPFTGLLFAIGRDITREKERERQLLQSERRFRSFFENSQSLMYTHDPDGKLLRVNASGARALGYEPAELVGRSLEELVPFTQKDTVHRYLEEIRKTGQTSGLMRTLHRNGSVQIWLYDNILETELDGTTYVIGNAVDITQRHQLEADLQWTKQMLEQTNEVARIGTWEVNLLQDTVYWSPMTKAIHEVGADFIPTFREAIDFFRGIHRERILYHFRQAIEHGETYDVELQIVTATGREIWVRAVGTPEFEGGVCKRLYGAFQDINNKKIAEQALLNEKARLVSFVENAPAAVAMFDCEMRYISVSRRWMEDYRLSTNVIGQSHYAVFPSISDEWKAVHARCIQGAMEKNDEDQWRPPDWEHDQYLRWEIRPWHQFDGSIGGIMMFTQDITEFRLQKEELKKAKLLAEQASVAKSEFLANMSHEIRTPMNAILSLGQQLTKTALSQQQLFWLSMINTAARNLLVIINDILDFSKIEAGQLSLERIGFEPVQLFQRALQVMEHQAQEKQLQLISHIDPGLAPVLLGDPYRLNQILYNLLSNAIKFTHQGSVTLDCRAYQQKQHQCIQLNVIDTGIGIDPEFQQKIFHKFTQQDGSIGRRYGGTGLGMSITRQLVDLMDGSITLESTPNVGTTIRISLCFPIGTAHDLPVPQQTAPLGKRLAGKRILLVEDNEMNRMVVQILLAPYGLVLTEATNGQQALEALQTQSFDLVLMDVQMPEMDGLEATRFIRRQISPTLPVIALTASAIRSEKDECYQAGMNDFLAKPFEETDLLTLLTKWLDVSADPSDSRHPLTAQPAEPRQLYDLSKLQAISRGDKEFIQRMITLFCQEAPTTLHQMWTEFRSSNLNQVQYLAHRLKPSVDNLGIRDQVETISRIEQLAGQLPVSPELETLLISFDQTIRNAVAQLKETNILEKVI